MGTMKGVPEEVKQHRKLMAAKREIKYLKESRAIDKKGLESRDRIIKDLNILVDKMHEQNGKMLSVLERQGELNRELLEGKPTTPTTSYIRFIN